MRSSLIWCLALLLALPPLWPAIPASARDREALPHTEQARIERLQAVAEAHRLTEASARKRADTQLFLGAFLIIGSLLTPLVAEIREEDFPAVGSILIGSVGLAVLIEGSVDDHQAGLIAGRTAVEEQIELIQQKSAGTAPADSLPPEDGEQRR